MMTKREVALLQESIDFMLANPNATNEDIPDKLLKSWAIEGFRSNPNAIPNSLQQTFFVHIYHEIILNKSGLFTNYDTYRYYSLFFSFQIILAATIYSRKYHEPLRSVKIFDLKSYRVFSYSLVNKKNLLKSYDYLTYYESNQEGEERLCTDCPSR